VDRDFDLNTVFCHHSSYWSQLYDLLYAQATNKYKTKGLEAKDNQGKEIQPIPVDVFNEGDEYW